MSSNSWPRQRSLPLISLIFDHFHSLHSHFHTLNPLNLTLNPLNLTLNPLNLTLNHTLKSKFIPLS